MTVTLPKDHTDRKRQNEPASHLPERLKAKVLMVHLEPRPKMLTPYHVDCTTVAIFSVSQDNKNNQAISLSCAQHLQLLCYDRFS